VPAQIALAVGLTLALSLGSPGCAGRAPVLPEDFPDDLTPYPNATLTRVESMPEGAFSLIWESPDELEAISRFLRDDLRARGWNPVREKRDRQRDHRRPPRQAERGLAALEQAPADPAAPEQRMIIARKAPRSATFLLARDGDRSRIELIVLPDDPL
jgi:hypothetical protein